MFIEFLYSTKTFIPIWQIMLLLLFSTMTKPRRCRRGFLHYQGKKEIFRFYLISSTPRGNLERGSQ